MTRSSSLRWSSNEKLYWKPEQPPPSTATRIMTALASLEARKAIRLAGRSGTEKGVVIPTRCGGKADSSMLTPVTACKPSAGKTGRNPQSRQGNQGPFAGPRALAMEDIEAGSDDQRQA